jgi:hypothetical protein
MNFSEVFRSTGTFAVSTTLTAFSAATVIYDLKNATMNKVAFIAGFILGSVSFGLLNEYSKNESELRAFDSVGYSSIGSRLQTSAYNAFFTFANTFFGTLPYGLSKVSVIAKRFFLNSFVLGVRSGAITANVVYQAIYMKGHYFPRNREAPSAHSYGMTSI